MIKLENVKEQEYEYNSEKSENDINEYYHFIESDFIKKIKKFMLEDTKIIFDIMINPSDKYYIKYGPKIKKSYISEYTGINKTEIEKHILTIKAYSIYYNI